MEMACLTAHSSMSESFVMLPFLHVVPKIQHFATNSLNCCYISTPLCTHNGTEKSLIQIQIDFYQGL